MTGQGKRAHPAERGSASIWLLGLVALVLAVTLTVLIQSAAILGRHRLQRSADLAALAAAGQIGLGSDPCQAARRIATANRAVLDRCVANLDPDGRSGTVAVWLSGRIGLPLLGPRSLHGRSRAGRLPGPGQQHPVPGQRCRGTPELTRSYCNQSVAEGVLSWYGSSGPWPW
jgi:secretion/DNA translocation related TadE-like protein